MTRMTREGWVIGDAAVRRSRRLARLVLLPVMLVGMLFLGQAGTAYGASTDWIYVVNKAGDNDYRLYRLSSGSLTQLYQSSSIKQIAVNPANGDVLAMSRASLELLNPTGQVQRRFYTDGDDVNTRAQVPNDAERGAWGVVWLAADRIVWSVEFEAKTPDPDEPNAAVGVVVGDLWGMNPYSDNSGSVVASPPNLGSMTWGYTYRMSMGKDGRILGQDKVLNMNPGSHGWNSKNGAWWVYPTAQQSQIWAEYDTDRVGDVCVDANNTPVLLVHANDTDANAASQIYLPTAGQSIDLGAHAKALACSPDTADQYAVAMQDGRVLVGGSGGFQEAARVPSGEAYDVDWPGFSSSSDPTTNPRVRVTFPRRNGRYSRRTVRRRFKNLRGRVSNSGGVNRVRVSIKRKRGKRCLWLTRRKMRRRSCRRPVYLSARGVSSWKVRLSKRQRRALKPGRYTLIVRLDDSSGNQMDADGRTTVRFRVRR